MKVNRNGPYMMNDAKKRYTEVKNSVKKDGEKKFQKETTNEKKKIDWEKLNKELMMDFGEDEKKGVAEVEKKKEEKKEPEEREIEPMEINLER